MTFDNPLVKKILLVVGILVVAELVFIGIFSGNSPQSTVLHTEPPAPASAPTPTTAATPSSPGRLTADAVAALPDEEPTPGFVYETEGKRDPFQPFDFSPKQAEREDLSPLERYEIGQLKLTAVLDGFDQPTAIVENAAGRGFTVRRGAKIGPNGGVITDILKDKILVEETITDFTGVSKTQTIEMPIRTKNLKEQP